MINFVQAMTSLWLETFQNYLPHLLTYLVDHNILIKKKTLQLNDLHNSSLAWVTSYLELRTQITFISGEQSRLGKVTAGVQQGSVLGPMLFFIYINDLSLPVSNSIADIFSDDTTFLTHNTSIDEIVATPTYEFCQVDGMCKQNHVYECK